MEIGKLMGLLCQRLHMLGSCRELIRCGFKKGCRGHCKCQKAALECTHFVLVVDYVVTVEQRINQLSCYDC